MRKVCNSKKEHSDRFLFNFPWIYSEKVCVCATRTSQVWTSSDWQNAGLVTNYRTRGIGVGGTPLYKVLTYTVDSLLTDTSVIQTETKSWSLPFFAASIWLSIRPTASAGPKGFRLRESRLYKLYMYVPPHRAGFLHRFGLKTGIHFAYFGLESDMVFRANYGSVWTYLCFNSKWVRN